MEANDMVPDMTKGMVESSRLSDLALTEDIRQVVLLPEIFNLTRLILKETDAIERKEQGGFFGGVLKNKTFYIFDNHLEGMGRTEKVRFRERMTISDDELNRRIADAFPEYRTVVYHNHAPVSEDRLRDSLGPQVEAYIEQIKKSLEMGIYEPLGIATVDEAINEEMSRMLSDEDIKNTPGRYNFLISPTARESNPIAHLNFYDLEKECLVPICAGDKEEIHEELKREKRVQRQWRIDTYGTSDIFSLDAIGRERAFLIHEGALNPYE